MVYSRVEIMDTKFLPRDKILGKQVIDSRGMIVGNVKDLSFDFETKGIAITVNTSLNTEIFIVGANIAKVGDVILLNKDINLIATPPVEEVKPAATPTVEAPQVPPSAPSVSAPSKPGLCKMCGFQNDPNSRFCIKCGSKLQ